MAPIEIDLNTADALAVCIIKDAVKRDREHGDDPEYTKQFVAACETVLNHFGESLDEPAALSTRMDAR